MNDRHVEAELSAYLDGEAKEPARIQRHLQTCPECARLHLEMLKLSARLRALPNPEASPDFSGRVLDRVAQAEPSRLHRWPVFALMAAGLVLTAGLAWFRGIGVQSSPGRVAEFGEAVAPSPMEQLASELAEDSDWGYYGDETERGLGLGVTHEDETALLTGMSLEDEDAYGERGDSFESIDALSREEMDALAEALETYLEEG